MDTSTGVPTNGPVLQCKAVITTERKLQKRCVKAQVQTQRRGQEAGGKKPFLPPRGRLASRRDSVQRRRPNKPGGGAVWLPKRLKGLPEDSEPARFP